MVPMRLPTPLWVILGLFVVVCTVFNVNTPYREPGILMFQRDQTGQPQAIVDVGAPDERQHANYIQHLKEGKGFPVFEKGSPELGETYQSHQPPLYYVLGAGWSVITGSDPTSPDSGVKLRFLNTLIGCLTLIGVFFGAKWGLGRDDVGLAAAAFAGFLPMSVALHSAVSNDPLLICICTWALALLTRGVQLGWSTKLAVGVGLLIGLGMLTKTSALILLPVAFVAFFLSSREHGEVARPGIKEWAAGLVLPLVIAAPWIARNMSLYGEPFVLKTFKEGFTGSPQAAMFIEQLGPVTYWGNFVTWWTVRSFVGVFGYMDIFLFEKMGMERSGLIYMAILVLLFSIVLLGQMGLREFREYAEKNALPRVGWFQALHLTLLFLAIASLIRFNMDFFQGQARYIFPALASFGFLFAMGIIRIMGDRREHAWIGTLMIMLMLNAVSFMTIVEGFAVRTSG